KVMERAVFPLNFPFSPFNLSSTCRNVRDKPKYPHHFRSRFLKDRLAHGNTSAVERPAAVLQHGAALARNRAPETPLQPCDGRAGRERIGAKTASGRAV